MTPAQTPDDPVRRGTVPGWMRVGVVGVAAVVTIMSGCTSASTSGTAGESTSATSSGSGEDHAEGQAQPSASSAGSPSAGSATRSGSSSGKGGKGGKDTEAAPAEKPTREPRPDAELSDEEIQKIYSDDAEPGRAVTVTLCHLTQGHLELLEEHAVGAGGGVDDTNLRLALISLGDLLDVWEGLTWHLPETAEDIGTAQEVYSLWDFALALQESGDPAGAQKQLEAASAAIERLPDEPDVEFGCGGNR